MKKHICILFCFAWTLTKAQTCETYNGKTINCTDKNFFKQGLWYEYKIEKILTTDSFNRNPNALGYHNAEGIIRNPIAEGFYKDNKRVGEWVYYVGTFYNDSYYRTSHTKQITFTEEGYFFEVDSFWHFKAKVSNDTSKLVGTAYLKNDTVNIRCESKECYLLNPFNKNRKKRFPYKNLDNILIYLNFYDQRANRTKNGS